MSKGSNLEFFKRVVANEEVAPDESRFIYPPTIATTLGFKVIDVAPGTATVELITDTTRHANPMGTIHGGVLCDIADAAIGMAHAAGLEQDQSFTSIDLQINFFRPFWDGRLRAVARPVNVGRQISRYTCDILRDDDKLIAQVTSTVMTLSGEKAQGR
jgi:uncharacterized protein (TIGR00369 family)